MDFLCPIFWTVKKFWPKRTNFGPSKNFGQEEPNLRKKTLMSFLNSKNEKNFHGCESPKWFGCESPAVKVPALWKSGCESPAVKVRLWKSGCEKSRTARQNRIPSHKIIPKIKMVISPVVPQGRRNFQMIAPWHNPPNVFAVFLNFFQFFSKKVVPSYQGTIRHSAIAATVGRPT